MEDTMVGQILTATDQAFEKNCKKNTIGSYLKSFGIGILQGLVDVMFVTGVGTTAFIGYVLLKGEKGE